MKLMKIKKETFDIEIYFMHAFMRKNVYQITVMTEISKVTHRDHQSL